MAMVMYAGDNDQTLPWWSHYPNPPPAGTDPRTWDSAIKPYSKNVAILVCPDNKYNAEDNDASQGTVKKRGYGMPRYVSGVMIDAPPGPSRTLLLTEKGGYTYGTWQDAAVEWPHQRGKQVLYTEKTLRHGKGNNFAYTDGHVKFHNYGQGPWVGERIDPSKCPGDPDGNPCALGHCEYPHIDWPPGDD